MKFPSFVRLFGGRRQRNSPARGDRASTRRPAQKVKQRALALEGLEERTLLNATARTVVPQFLDRQTGFNLVSPVTAV
jgi:hypothetical protein